VAEEEAIPLGVYSDPAATGWTTRSTTRAKESIMPPNGRGRETSIMQGVDYAAKWSRLPDYAAKWQVFTNLCTISCPLDPDAFTYTVLYHQLPPRTQVRTFVLMVETTCCFKHWKKSEPKKPKQPKHHKGPNSELCRNRSVNYQLSPRTQIRSQSLFCTTSCPPGPRCVHLSLWFRQRATSIT
jgi:hypothetical protein